MPTLEIMADREIWKRRAEKAEAELTAIRESSRWIPVGEKHPDEDMRVMLYFIGGAAGTVLGWWTGKDWSSGVFGDVEKLLNVKITHWQPLPQGPEVRG